MKNETHLRLAIKGGGCSGFIKELDYCQTKDIGFDRRDEMIEEFSDGMEGCCNCGCGDFQ